MAHPVTDRLASATSHAERHALKAAAFVALPHKDRKVKVGAYTVALVDHPVIGPSGLLEFHVKITKGSKDETPPGMVGPDGAPGHIRVWQPPILHDGREDLEAALLVIAGNLVATLP